MKRAFATLLLLAAGFGLFHASQAQFASTDPITLTLTPDYPRPYQQVIVVPESSIIDLTASTVVVTVNGKEVSRGSGAEAAYVTVGGPGTATTVKVTATTNGQTYSKSLTIRPAEVSLVLEPTSTTHPFYEGGSLVASEGGVRLVAIPDIRTSAGAVVPAANLVYTWKNGDQILEGSSGIGKSVLSAVAPPKWRDAGITVTVTTQDRSIVAQAASPVTPSDPYIRVYRNDPLLGPLYGTALPDSIALTGDEETYRAVPYYFSTKPSFTWSVNGTPSDSDEDVTVRRYAASGRRRNVSILRSGAFPWYLWTMIKRAFSSISVVMILVTLILPLYAAAQTPQPPVGSGSGTTDLGVSGGSGSSGQSAASAPSGTAPAANSFVPLTNLPGLTNTVNSDTLPTFFNNLYKLCIGAAAVIAILQIMRAGTYFFFNKGSVAHNEKAKGLIANSVLGLLLVLSPAIIFGIINPDILHLNLDVSRLKTNLTPRLASLTPDEAAAACQVTISSDQSVCMSTETSSIRPSYAGCIGSGGDNPATRQTCLTHAQTSYDQAARKCFTSPALNATQLSCMKEKFDFTSSAPPPVDHTSTLNERCEAVYERVIATNTAQQCTASRGVHLEASNSCCSGVSAGSVCCGISHPPPDPIDVITLGTQRGTGGLINVDDIYETDKLRYTGFRTSCLAVNGVGHADLGNSPVRCPNQAAGAAPTCQMAHLTCSLP
jgi:hypothetical protein